MAPGVRAYFVGKLFHEIRRNWELSSYRSEPNHAGGATYPLPSKLTVWITLMSDHDHQHSHDPAHGTDHAHGAGHGHGHAPKDFGLAFAVGTTLNLGFVVAEVVYGLLANSIALVADAGHNLGDVLGLVMAWVATILARRSPSMTHTYGLRRGTILAALANAVLLLVTIGGIFIEGIRRLIHPAEVDSATIMVVAAIGIAVNGVTAWLFASGRKGDINLRAAFMHMAGDALVSVGVVVAGAIILFTGWSWLDPLNEHRDCRDDSGRNMGIASRLRRHVARCCAGWNQVSRCHQIFAATAGRSRNS